MMGLRDRIVGIGVVVAAVAGAGAWALYGFMSERSDSSYAGPTRAPVNLRGAAPGPIAVDNAPSASAVVPMTAGDRFKLVGMMNSGSERIVLIAVDGKPAQMFRVGDTVDGATVVRAVSERGASLGAREGGSAMALEMSQVPPQATVVAPVPKGPAVSRAALADGSVQAQEALRGIGSKYAPLAPPMESAPPKPVYGTVAPADDGRWRPAGQQ